MVLILLALVTSNTVNFAQVHYEDVTTQGGDATAVNDLIYDYDYVEGATSGLGNFYVGNSGTGLRYFGHDGNTIAQTDPITSNTYFGDANITVACNHNSEVAIVNLFKGSGNTPETKSGIRILRNHPAYGQINMNKDRILESTLPNYTGVWTFPNIGTPAIPVKVWHLEAKVNDHYLYITWKQTAEMNPCVPGASHYGFCVFDITNNSFTVIPQLINDPDGNHANGKSAPTIATNRWSESMDHVRIAFSYLDQTNNNNVFRQYAAVFTPVLFGPQPNAQHLPEPINATNSQECMWVRAVDYDEPDGNSGYHFFYAYYYPIVDDPTINLCLFSTDGTIVSNVINNRLPPAEEENFAPPAVGNGYTEKAVYLVYKTEEQRRVNASQPKPRDELDICTQWGNGNYTNIWVKNSFIYAAGYNILSYTLGCNQTGINVLYSTDNPTGNNIRNNLYWRAFRPIAQHIRENLVLTEFNRIEQNQWHQFGNESDIWILPSETMAEKADTLRIKKYTGPTQYLPWWPFDGPGATLQYHSVTEGVPISLNAGVPSGQPVIQANWNNGKRGYIIMDAGGQYDPDDRPTIDFNNIHNCSIGAASNGGFEYNGTNLVNMNQTTIFTDGNHNHPDTLEKYRGLGYFNAPCTIDNASVLFSNKGQFRFKHKNVAGNDITTQADMALFSTNGIGTRIWMDTAMVLLGARNTSQPLEQIRMNGDASGNRNQQIVIKNSVISTGWENLSAYAVMAAGYCSQLTIKAPVNTYFDHNRIYAAYINVFSPLGNLTFDFNKIYDIRYGLNVVWEDRHGDGYPQYYPGDMVVNYNQIMANFPRGGGAWTDPAIDFKITGFRKLRADNPQDMNDHGGYIEINGNTIYQSNISLETPFQSNRTGIQIDWGTIAYVNDNTIYNIGTGIYHDGSGTSTATICSNDIAVIPTECDPNMGIGIRQNWGKGTTSLNELHHLSMGYLGENSDESSLLRNNIFDNKVGAKFIDDAKSKLNGGTSGGPGMNEFDNNTVTGTTSTSICQIQIVSQLSTGLVPQPVIGTDVSGDEEQYWGQNKFHSTGNRIHIQHVCDGCSNSVLLNPTLKLNDWNPAIVVSANVISANQDQMVENLDHYNQKNVIASLAEIPCPLPYTGPPLGAGGKKTGPLAYPARSYLLDDTADTLYLYKRASMHFGAKEYREALDTFKLYCELHPFAISYPGEVLSALDYTLGCTGNLLPYPETNDWIRNYNWAVRMYPVNPATPYQATVVRVLAGSLAGYDRNGAANMWYNYTLLFPDNGSVKLAWKNIKSIRDYQHDISEDTTPFHVLKFPPDTLALEGVKPPVAQIKTTVNIGIVPNPSRDASEATLDVSARNVYDIRLYDALGKEVMKVYSGLLDAGKHNFTLSIKDMASGTYYLRVQYLEGVVTRSLVVER